LPWALGPGWLEEQAPKDPRTPVARVRAASSRKRRRVVSRVKSEGITRVGMYQAAKGVSIRGNSLHFSRSLTAALIEAGKATMMTRFIATKLSIPHGHLSIIVSRTATTIRAIP
jgi:hypothetical protein